MYRMFFQTVMIVHTLDVHQRILSNIQRISEHQSHSRTSPTNTF